MVSPNRYDRLFTTFLPTLLPTDVTMIRWTSFLRAQIYYLLKYKLNKTLYTHINFKIFFIILAFNSLIRCPPSSYWNDSDFPLRFIIAMNLLNVSSFDFYSFLHPSFVSFSYNLIFTRNAHRVSDQTLYLLVSISIKIAVFIPVNWYVSCLSQLCT